MIPNVYFKWNTRLAHCKWCTHEINMAEPVVVVFFWNKGDKDKRKYNVKRYYHPSCWIEQGLDYLKMNPYTPAGERGRKVTLNETDRRERYLLVRRKAALEQRKRNLTVPYPDNVAIIAAIDIKINNIIVDMVRLGGVPKKWAEAMLDGQV